MAATFMVDHFDLFGLHEAWHRVRETRCMDPLFAHRRLYRAVLHAIVPRATRLDRGGRGVIPAARRVRRIGVGGR